VRRRRVLVLALLAASCTPEMLTEPPERAAVHGWREITSATGTIRVQEARVTECRWDLPCQRGSTEAFETTGGPLKLSCTGRPDLLFVEYFHGPEPTSGNSAMCPSDGISAILWVPSGRTASFYLEAARVPRDAVPGQALTWSLAVQVWEKPWRKPTYEKDRSGVPRGLWAMCGDGPLGFAVPAPTPAR
jgi:hypothetical protein